MIKIGFPIISQNGLSSEVSDHFGMAEDFAIATVDNDRIISLEFAHNDPNVRGGKNPAKFLAEIGVNIVIAGSIGPHMIAILLKEGIRIFRDAEGTIEEVFEDFKDNRLSESRTAEDMD